MTSGPELGNRHLLLGEVVPGLDDGTGLGEELLGPVRRRGRGPELVGRLEYPRFPGPPQRLGGRRHRPRRRLPELWPGADPGRALPVPDVVGPVGLPVGDDLFGHGPPEGQAGLDVAGEAGPGPHPRHRRFLGHLVETGGGQLGVEVGEQLRRGPGDDRVLRGVRRVGARGGQGGEAVRRLPLVGVLPVPGRHRGVVDGDAHQGVPPRRRHRVLGPLGHEVQVHLGPDLVGGVLAPALHRLFHLRGALTGDLLELGRFGLGLSAGRRWRDLDRVGRFQHPRLPRAGTRLGSRARGRIGGAITVTRSACRHRHSDGDDERADPS